jgi:galactoside O-acetyltransferase
VQLFYERYGNSDCFDRLDWTNVRSAPILICDRVWIGFGATILKGVTIGEGAIIASRSVVTQDVEAYTVVAGNPARAVRKLETS